MFRLRPKGEVPVDLPNLPVTPTSSVIVRVVPVEATTPNAPSSALTVSPMKLNAAKLLSSTATRSIWRASAIRSVDCW